jgi:hypothetical protein
MDENQPTDPAPMTDDQIRALTCYSNGYPTERAEPTDG